MKLKVIKQWGHFLVGDVIDSEIDLTGSAIDMERVGEMLRRGVIQEMDDDTPRTITPRA